MLTHVADSGSDYGLTVNNWMFDIWVRKCFVSWPKL